MKMLCRYETISLEILDLGCGQTICLSDTRGPIRFVAAQHYLHLTSPELAYSVTLVKVSRECTKRNDVAR